MPRQLSARNSRTTANRRPSAHARRGPALPRNESSELPIDEIAARFPGEWVAVKVTTWDAQQRIAGGQVLGHSASRKRVSRALMQAHQDNPSAHTYVFFGGTPPATVEEWRAGLAGAAGAIKDYRDAWW